MSQDCIIKKDSLEELGDTIRDKFKWEMFLEGMISGQVKDESNFTITSLPEGLTEIGPYAFYWCHQIPMSLSIPEGVTRLGEHAFYASGLTSIILPKSMKVLGNSCLFSTNLETVTFNSRPLETGDFIYPSYPFVINVPWSEEENNGFPFPSNATVNYNYTEGSDSNEI